jgi:hypothetical protein
MPRAGFAEVGQAVSEDRHRSLNHLRDRLALFGMEFWDQFIEFALQGVEVEALGVEVNDGEGLLIDEGGEVLGSHRWICSEDKRLKNECQDQDE